MTGSSAQTALMSQVVDFAVYGTGIDMEKIRTALYCQVQQMLAMCFGLVSNICVKHLLEKIETVPDLQPVGFRRTTTWF